MIVALLCNQDDEKSFESNKTCTCMDGRARPRFLPSIVSKNI